MHDEGVLVQSGDEEQTESGDTSYSEPTDDDDDDDDDDAVNNWWGKGECSDEDNDEMVED
jgi:hypothetical protein